METVIKKLSEIIFDEGIYPRIEGHDPARVQEYAQDIEQIEAAGKYISINADNKLVDGRHRHLSYKKNADGNEDIEIQVYQYPVSSPLESFTLALELQDMGKPLERGDREAAAKKLYSLGCMDQKEIAKRLSVTPGRISQWLSRTIKDEKERNKKKVIAMWMACHTQETIAEAVGVTQQTVDNWIGDFTNNLNSKEFVKFNFQDDFKIPIYNVWKTQNKTNEVSHAGNTEQKWLENLLYLYTKPFDIVIDPFGGGGSTIDVCKKRGRRYFVSDRKPIIERENEIRKWDITEGLPSIPRWKDTSLVYLDPPYWKQAEGKYSDSPNDLSNMPLDEFNETLSNLICKISKKLQPASIIALIIQPTQWKSPEKNFTDHVSAMIRRVKLPIIMRVSCPYESQQCTAQMVEWAKENKQLLVLSRELIIWRT